VVGPASHKKRVQGERKKPQTGNKGGRGGGDLWRKNAVPLSTAGMLAAPPVKRREREKKSQEETN